MCIKVIVSLSANWLWWSFRVECWILNIQSQLSTTPITTMECRQCLYFSVAQLKGKHCRKHCCRNGVVDTFRHSLSKLCQNQIGWWDTEDIWRQSYFFENSMVYLKIQQKHFFSPCFSCTFKPKLWSGWDSRIQFMSKIDLVKVDAQKLGVANKGPSKWKVLRFRNEWVK